MKNIFSLQSRFSSNSQQRDFETFLQDIMRCMESLQAIESQRSVEIYTEDTYYFLVAFFAALLKDFEVFVLPKNLSSNKCLLIDDRWVENILKNPLKMEVQDLTLSLQKQFFVQTSGSSGERKNITKTLQQMVEEAQFLQKEFGITPSHCFFSSASHQHLYGLTFKIFLPLISGSKIFCHNLNYPELILEYLDSANSTKPLVFLSSPVLLETIIRHKNLHKFSKIEKIVTAGSKLDEGIFKQLVNTLAQVQFIEIYGSTETGVIARNLGEGFKIFDGIKATRDNDMRLIVKSPWQQGDKDAGFLTSDCVEITGNDLKILGRYDRIVKLHDRRVSLDGIEKLLNSHSFVKKALIRQDECYNRLSALVVLSLEGEEYFKRFGKKGIVSALIECLKEEFPNKVRYFYICETLPYDAQGKISKTGFLNCISERKEPDLRLLSNDNNILKAKAYIPLDCFYFSGHFLNFPLVPGFMELSFVYTLLRRHWGIHYATSKEVENIKFTHFLRPKDELLIEISKNNDKIYFKLFANDKQCASGRLRLQ